MAIKINDDQCFGVSDDELWKEIDFLFHNTYFERTWIKQEIEVANTVYVCRGRFQIPWEVFEFAHRGRSLIVFKEFSDVYTTSPFSGAVSCVTTARRWYRGPSLEFDLAAMLTTFTYSKEHKAQDRIYGALGLVKPPTKPSQILTPDYNKTAAQVFYDAAAHSINKRKDLYLWGNKTLRSNRKIENLPRWVPEWNGVPCEMGSEYFSYEFSHCIPEPPRIMDLSLHVKAHVLDRIKYVTRVDTAEQIIHIFSILNCFLSKPNSEYSGLFEPYIGRVQEDQFSMSSSITPHDLQFQNLTEVVAILSTLKTVPTKMLTNLLRGFSSPISHPLDHSPYCLF